MTADIEHLIEDWLNEQSPNTRRGYRGEIERWLVFLQRRGIEPLAATRGDVAAFRNQPGARKPVPEPATIARRLAAVSSFYRYLAASDVIAASPAEHVKRPKVDHESATRGMDEGEAMAFLTAARKHSPAAWVLVTLMMLEGLRVSEATGATIEAVTIHQGIQVLKIKRKGEKRKYVTLGGQSLAAIAAASKGRTRGPLATHNDDGDPFTYARAYGLVRRLAYAAGLEQPESIRPHSLRHTFATLALNAGVPLRDVRDALSHSSVDTTSRYDRARDAAERHPVKALEAHLGLGVADV